MITYILNEPNNNTCVPLQHIQPIASLAQKLMLVRLLRQSKGRCLQLHTQQLVIYNKYDSRSTFFYFNFIIGECTFIEYFLKTKCDMHMYSEVVYYTNRKLDHGLGVITNKMRISFMQNTFLFIKYLSHHFM